MRPRRPGICVPGGFAVALTFAACRAAGGTPPPPPSPTWTPPPAPEETIVAQVGGRVVSAERLRARLSAEARELPPTLEAALEEEVRFALLLQAAYDRGLARDVEVVDHAQRVMVRRLLQTELSAYADGERPDEKTLRAAYEAHRGQYVRPPKRQLSGVQLGRGEADRLRAQAVLAALPVPVPVDFLAGWRRGHPQARRLQALEAQPWWDEEALAGRLGEAAAAAIMAAPVGAVVPEVLGCPAGWCLVQVVDEREGRVRDFETVRDEVREKLEHGLRGEQFERLVGELRGVYPVRIDEAARRALAAGWPAAGGAAR